MSTYKKRIIDKVIDRRLKNKGAILIEGAKWCGKTTCAEQQAASVLYLSDPENLQQNLKLADISPKKLLEGASPRLIDEWQLAPKLWDAVRFEVDHREGFGQFLLTGSALPVETSEIHHSGTGRFVWLKMRPMSLYESGESNGEISLSDLFLNPKGEFFSTNKLKLEDLAFLTCRGGWPQATSFTGDPALAQAFNYYDAVLHTDLFHSDSVNRDVEKIKRLMQSYSRYQGTQATISSLSVETRLNRETVTTYINALRRIFVIEDMCAWNPNLRSKTAIRSSDTRYFVDPSIATVALGIGPNDLINDLNTFGLLFETLCVRDLRVFADALNATVYHYRDKSGLECDAVIHLRDGSYGLIEIKLGGDRLIEEGVTSLKKLSSLIDTTKMEKPSFLMVLTGTSPYAYKRDDGVFIVPIGCLKD